MKKIILTAGIIVLLIPAVLYARDSLEDMERILRANDSPGFCFSSTGSEQHIVTMAEKEESRPSASRDVNHLTDDGGDHTISVTVSPDGRFLLWYRGKVRFSCEPGDYFCPLFITADNRYLFALTDWNNDFVSLLKIDLYGTNSATCIAAESSSNIDGIVTMGGDGKEIAATYSLGDGIQYTFHSSSLASVHMKATAMFSDADILWREGDAAGKRWLCSVLRGDQPDEWYCFSDDNDVPETVYASPTMPGMTSPRTLQYPARDGQTVSGYLTLPDGAKPGALPLVVFIHGGPSLRVYPWFDPRVQLIVRRGMAVFQPNYRGSNGFGKKWMRGGWRQWGTGAAQDDITDGVRSLIKSGVADPERVAVFGGSFGGYGAMASLAYTPELYRCGASFFGPSDLVALMGDNGTPLADLDKLIFGDYNNADDIKRLLAQSPLHSPKGIGKPLFLYHGADDKIVPVKHSDAVARAMKSAGIYCEYYRHPVAGHGFTDTRHEAAVFFQILNFFDQFLLKKAPAPIPENIKILIKSMRLEGKKAGEEASCPEVMM